MGKLSFLLFFVPKCLIFSVFPTILGYFILGMQNKSIILACGPFDGDYRMPVYLQLVVERFRGIKASPFSPYISMLPAELTSPLFFPQYLNDSSSWVCKSLEHTR